jgi:transposase-like protein
MARGQTKAVPGEIKREVLKRIENGESVLSLAAEYGISDKTIYCWLRKSTEKISTGAEVARLKKKISELNEFIGMLAFEVNKQKKEI